MKSLEEDIELLSDLDALRIRSANIRDEGRQALRDIAKGLAMAGWEDPGDVVEKALIIKALCYRSSHESPLESLVDDLEKMTLQQAFDLTSDEVPVLRAARAMQALVAAPDSAFSKATMYFYYRIVREICSADAPDWTMGGARVGDGGSATAFMTGECVRAILGFARTLDQTGTLIGEIRNVKEPNGWDQNNEIPPDWCGAERDRRRLSFFITLKVLSGNIAFPLGQPLSQLSLESVDRFLASFIDDLKVSLTDASQHFSEAYEELQSHRELERQDQHFERSESGHLIALGAVKQAYERATQARDLFTTRGDELDSLRRLEAMFHEVADDVRKLLYPARGYISAVLDRELAAASVEGNLGWDPREMAFAAVSYGAMTGSWDDERLLRAGLHLSRVLSDRGRFPMGRPIYSKKKGYRLHVVGAEVLRAFAQLLQHVPKIPIDIKLVGSMMAFFDDTRSARPGPPSLRGWNHEEPPQPVLSCRWVTALSVLALDRINRMLDERIDLLVFKHFTVRQPSELPKNLTLPNLFYADYGLRQAPAGGNGLRRQDSIAILLERMRAHVVGVSSLRSSWNPLYSLVLHGPAGTGKTTLVEALASSCGVPLVEITPSDIVMGGEEAVERRARAVFKALSLLTRAVIIFDEFDPVLARRDPGAKTPSTVFTFLTPGMLPKLKNLNQTSRRRGVAYVLVTNLIGTLDEAAVRSGRFDEKAGIFPPDLLSRVGRLWSEILELHPVFRNPQEIPAAFKERVRTAVIQTAGAPMEILGRPGWFTRPQSLEALRPGTLFHYLFKGEPEPSWRAPEATLTVVLGTGPTAVQEYLQWAWIHEWDKELRNEVSLKEALVAFPREEEEPEWPFKGPQLEYMIGELIQALKSRELTGNTTDQEE